MPCRLRDVGNGLITNLMSEFTKLANNFPVAPIIFMDKTKDELFDLRLDGWVCHQKMNVSVHIFVEPDHDASAKRFQVAQ